MDEIIEGVARFRAEPFPALREEYGRLVREGQSPSALVIACSDSRVAPETITASGPGTMFVSRNAGNVVPEWSADAGCPVGSAIEYAVVALGVRHVVVCGHTDCGAMKGLVHPEALETMPGVARWLQGCGCRAEEGADVRSTAMRNVGVQLERLRGYPYVAERLDRGELTLHGWIFDIEEGAVLARDEGGGFAPLGEIA